MKKHSFAEKKPKVLARILTAFTLVGLLAGCGMKSPGNGAASSGSGGGGGAAATTGKLNASVYTIWDTDTTNALNLQSTCSASAATNIAYCAINIPEAQLFFSKLKIKIFPDATSTCAIITFRPYYYLASSQSFTPQWSSAGAGAVDCTVSPTPATCFNGIGTTMMATFATFKSEYYTPSAITGTDLSQSWQGTSANTNLRINNRWASNDWTTAQRLAGLDNTGAASANGAGGAAAAPASLVSADGLVADGTFVAGTALAPPVSNTARFSDYQVQCRDSNFELLYALIITINDTNGATDNFHTWSSASWP